MSSKTPIGRLHCITNEHPCPTNYLLHPADRPFLADLYAIYLLSRAVGGERWRTHFWVTLLLFVGSPIYWMVSGYALPDHLLLTGCLYALYFFFRFFQ